MDEHQLDSLIISVASGDKDAFSALYLEMKKTVFLYALSITRSRQLAEDVTHDVFVKIRLSAEKFKPTGKAKQWILTVTRNIALNAIMKQKHEQLCDLLPENTSDSSAEKINDGILLKQALEKLSKAERQIVLLYLVAGISQKDISKLLKLPVTAVNWKYRSGIKKMSVMIGEEAYR